ncbi:MAG: hypothetical protein RSE41_10780, partial [Clostridia bacterium]
MLCSVCKKNMAIIFINKLDKNGKSTNETTGLCVECAKKQGVNPISNMMNEMNNLTNEDFENMSSQLGDMLGNLSEFENNNDGKKGF